MRLRNILTVLPLALLCAAPAGAICTKTGTIAPGVSTEIVGANDLAPTTPQGRRYFILQNTGATNPMNVAIGSNNNATSTDLSLGPGASWVMTMMGSASPNAPSGDVAAYSASGTTYSFCDF